MAAPPLLLGHRGARHEAPENTLEAFDLCLRHGCDGFEFDVRLCADSKSVICHDPKLGRREVAKARFSELHAPGLEDVLARFSSRAFLDIELKVEGLEQHVIELLRQYPATRGCIVSSFLPRVVENLYRIDRNQRLGLICESRVQLAGWTGSPAGALFLERGLCTAAVTDALHRGGRKVFVWTVNREREMREFASLGVDGIIADDTALLARTLGGNPHGGGTHEEG
jgi:glycerophosphoryl diester phosphodiesterase